MANCAAHLVDRVVPDVPVRHYVLSLPYELRRLAAFKQDVLGAFVKIFIDAVSARYRARAKLEGAEVGAITFVQRFGGSLNLNLHLHVAFLDGVFTRDEQRRVQFHPAPAPEATELQQIVWRVQKRATAWLRRHGYVDERPSEARSDEAPEQGAIGACAAIAMQRGAFAKLAAEEDTRDEVTNGKPASLRFAAEHEGCKVGARRRARLSPGRFPSAPFRTRRAPFVEHRALHRWRSELRGCLLTQLEGAYAYARHFEWEDVAVPPTKLSPAWLAPAVSRRNDPPVCAAVLLLDPSKDGPPQVVVERAEDTLRSPRMAVEVAETAKN